MAHRVFQLGILGASVISSAWAMGQPVLTVLDRSPFVPQGFDITGTELKSPSKATTHDTGFELNGVYSLNGRTHANLSSKTQADPFWITVGETKNGVTLESFDPAANIARIQTANGQSISIEMKQRTARFLNPARLASAAARNPNTKDGLTAPGRETAFQRARRNTAERQRAIRRARTVSVQREASLARQLSANSAVVSNPPPADSETSDGPTRPPIAPVNSQTGTADPQKYINPRFRHLFED